MLLKTPDYYKDFRCIAGACKDSCCIGWEIDIDEDTKTYYEQVKGSFGESLRAHMVQADQEDIDPQTGLCMTSFELSEGRRCPFLNEENLCDICIELGEEALSEVCTEYPRFTMEYFCDIEKPYTLIREKCMALSCEEVGRLLFTKEEAVKVETRELPDQDWMEEDREEWESEEDEEENREEARLAGLLLQARDYAIQILQKRNLDLTNRIIAYIDFYSQIQQLLNENLEDEIPGLIQSWECTGNQDKMGNSGEIEDIDPFRQPKRAMKDSFFARQEGYDKMEILDEEWRTCLLQMREWYTNTAETEIHQTLRHLNQEIQGREYEQEHLLVYFTFRYMMRAVFDRNVLCHAQFTVVSFLTIRDMALVRFASRGHFTVQDCIDVVRIYSKEVEHSEENLDLLRDCFLYDEIFEPGQLKHQL